MGESDDCTLRWVGLGLVMAVALVLGLASRGMKALLYFIDGCGSIFGGWGSISSCWLLEWWRYCHSLP